MRSGQADTEEHRGRVKEIEQRLKENNQRRDQEMRDLEEKERMDEQELERQKKKDSDDRKKAIEEVGVKARLEKEEADAQAMEDKEPGKEVIDGVDSPDSDLVCTDSELLQATEGMEHGLGLSITESVEPAHADAGDKAMLVAMQHKAWLEGRTPAEGGGEQLNVAINPEMERIFGPGATRMDIEYQANGQATQQVEIAEAGSESGQATQPVGVAEADPESGQDDVEGNLSWSDQVDLNESGIISDQADDRLDKLLSSTPKKQRRGRKRVKSEGRVSTGSVSPVRSIGSESNLNSGDGVDLLTLGSSFSVSGSEVCESQGNEKKLRLEDQVDSDGGFEGGLQKSSSTEVEGVDSLIDVLETTMVEADRKGDSSDSGDELSSGVTGEALPPGSSGKESDGVL